MENLCIVNMHTWGEHFFSTCSFFHVPEFDSANEGACVYLVVLFVESSKSGAICATLVQRRQACIYIYPPLSFIYGELNQWRASNKQWLPLLREHVVVTVYGGLHWCSYSQREFVESYLCTSCSNMLYGTVASENVGWLQDRDQPGSGTVLIGGT